MRDNGRPSHSVPCTTSPLATHIPPSGGSPRNGGRRRIHSGRVGPPNVPGGSPDSPTVWPAFLFGLFEFKDDHGVKSPRPAGFHAGGFFRRYRNQIGLRRFVIWG